MVTIEDCYEIRSFLKRTISRCMYKYSMTRNKDYLKIVKDSKALQDDLTNKDISELDISRIKAITNNLYIRMRGVDNDIVKS